MELSFKVKEAPEVTEVSDDNVIAEVKSILKSVHKHPAKLEVDTSTSGRLKIACPYCGDSDKSPAKKRGIIYLTTGTYKCWNGGCGVWRPIKDFFEDYGSKIAINLKDFEVDSYISNSKNENIAFSIFDVYNIKDKLFDRDELLDKMGLVDIEFNVTASRYIASRKLDIYDKRMAVNPRSGDIVFFNMTKSDKVIGLQIRKNKVAEGRPRFLSFSYGDILEKIYKKEDVDRTEVDKIKRISLIYNILRVDLSKPLNVFESSVNSHHFTNAIACWGTGSVLKLHDASYFMDCDVAGRTKAIDLIKSKHKVFMWTLFKKLNPVFKNDGDINDLFKRGLKDTKPLFDFLTDNRLDIIKI